MSAFQRPPQYPESVEQQNDNSNNNVPTLSSLLGSAKYQPSDFRTRIDDRQTKINIYDSSNFDSNKDMIYENAAEEEHSKVSNSLTHLHLLSNFTLIG